MENIIEKLNEKELDLLIRIAESYVSSEDDTVDYDLIVEASELDNPDILYILSDVEKLDEIVGVLEDNGLMFNENYNEEEYHECEVDEAQKMLDLKLSSLALSEEEDRLERLHDMSDLNTESDVVKEALEMANSYAVIVKTLVNQGISEKDAIILGNTYVSSKIDKEIREIDSVALKNNMV